METVILHFKGATTVWFFAHLCGGNIDAVLIVVRGDCFVPLSKKAKIFFLQKSVVRKQRV
jgi:hypothetical protein